MAFHYVTKSIARIAMVSARDANIFIFFLPFDWVCIPCEHCGSWRPLRYKSIAGINHFGSWRFITLQKVSQGSQWFPQGTQRFLYSLELLIGFVFLANIAVLGVLCVTKV